jgi:hypothetical protein
MNKPSTWFFAFTMLCIIASTATAPPQASRARPSDFTKAIQEGPPSMRRVGLRCYIATPRLIRCSRSTCPICSGDSTADDKASTLALFSSSRLRYAQLDYV